MILNFKINEQKLRRLDNNYVVNLSKEYLQCNFEYSDDWSNLTKYVTFSVKGRHYRFEIDNGVVRVPNDVLKYKYFYIQAHGVNSDGEQVLTTDELIIILKVSGYSDTLSPSSDVEVTDIYTLLKNKIDKKIDNFRLEEHNLICCSGNNVVQIIPLVFLDNYYDKDEINVLLNKTIIDVDTSELADNGYLIFEKYNL